MVWATLPWSLLLLGLSAREPRVPPEWRPWCPESCGILAVRPRWPPQPDAPGSSSQRQDPGWGSGRGALVVVRESRWHRCPACGSVPLPQQVWDSFVLWKCPSSQSLALRCLWKWSVCVSRFQASSRWWFTAGEPGPLPLCRRVYSQLTLSTCQAGGRGPSRWPRHQGPRWPVHLAWRASPSLTSGWAGRAGLTALRFLLGQPRAAGLRAAAVPWGGLVTPQPPGLHAPIRTCPDGQTVSAENEMVNRCFLSQST